MYTDIEDSKVRYKKLFRIGITNKEMKKVIIGFNYSSVNLSYAAKYILFYYEK